MAMNDLPVTISERYSVLEPLRSTAFSRIFRALQRSTGQEVAIKVLATRGGEEADSRDRQVQRFQQEARFCASLHHPNIVPLLDFGETEGGEAFAVFSYVPGMDLGSTLAAGGPLDTAEAVHFMSQAIDAIGCAHAKGIVHRDLKPENIMISATGARRNALVLDFGIGAFAADWGSPQIGRLTETGEYLGTPAYSAPEQLLGGPTHFSTDLYAWGIIFLECLMGRPAMNGQNPYALVHRHLSPDPIPIPPVLEKTPLGELLRLVTMKSVADRTISAAEVLNELLRIPPGSLPSRVLDEAAPRTSRPPTSSLKRSSTWLVPLLRNHNFTGRTEPLQRIRESLETTRLLAVVALHGLGGVGKTQLALEYAYRHAGDYRLVAWIHAEQPETIAAGYSSIGRALNLLAKPNEREMLEDVRSWLERNDRWLLVFDNVRDPATIRPYLPRSQTGHILVTSRHQSWRGLAASVAIDVLDRHEAVDFLLRRTGEIDEKQAAELSHELGRLPLALEEAAAYIEATGRTIGSYIPLLRSHRDRVLPPTADRSGAVRTTWELSFREIEQDAPASLDLLKVCAFLAPDDIPRALFRVDGDGAPETLRAPLRDEIAFDECIATLRRYSLIRREPDSLSIHRLVQLATRERLTERERAQWTGTALSLMEGAYPADAIAGDSSPESGRLLPHAMSVLSQPDCHEFHPQLAASVLRRTGIYMSARGLHDRARENLERALALFERASDPDAAQIGGTLWELGMVLYAIGEPESARERLELALRVLAKKPGPATRVLYPQSLIALAWVLRTLGRFEETHAIALKCLELVERLAGPYHPLVAMSLALMARADWSLNRIAAARANLDRAHAVLEQVKNSLPLICGTWYALAQVHLDLGELDLAFTCATRGLAVGEPAYGRDHPLVCLNVSVQGSVHLRRGDLLAARRDLESTLESGQRSSHRLHEDIAAARSELASAILLGGDAEASLRHLKHALVGIKGLCGDTARVEGQTRIALAATLRAMGCQEEAIDECKMGLDLIQARYGSLHPLRIGGLNTLGWLLLDTGAHDASETAFAEAMSIAESAGMRSSVDCAEGLEGLGVLQLARGYPEEARRSFEGSLQGMTQVLGDAHPSARRVAGRLHGGEA
jgi:serine/threonine protein kinase